MGKIVIVSIEGSEVKIIHSSKKWKTIRIDKKENIKDSELADYLDREKAKEIIVVCDFDEYSHDVLILPALKQKYIKKVVESEIRKATGKTNFTFVYSILGDKVVDNKKMLEVFYYMVTDEAVRSVVERFYDHGKIVKALYPSVFTAASLLDYKNSNKIKMGMIVSGYKRIVFTSTNGIVNFVRDYKSIETSISDFDIQNVNATIEYCARNLRVNPTSVTFLGDLRGLYALESKPDIPVVAQDMPDNIKCSGKATCDYSIPCGGLNVTRRVSILSESFEKIYILRRLLEGASMTFVLIAVICLGMTLHLASDIYKIKNDIQSILLAPLGDEKNYEKKLNKQAAMKDIVTVVNFLNMPSIDIHALLVDMSAIELQHLRFDKITAQAEGDAAFLIAISGSGLKNTYSTYQSSFDKLVNRLEQMNNVKLREKVINHMQNTFLVKLYYGK